MVVVDGCLLRLALSGVQLSRRHVGSLALLLPSALVQGIIILFALELRLLWLLFVSNYQLFQFFFLIISLNLELGLYMMTKGMNDLTHTPLLCIPKVHRSLELLSIYFALSNFTFFYSKCTCLHTTSGQSHLHVPYVFTYIQYINACLYFYIGKCMQHNMHTLRKKTFRHKR